MRIQVVGVSGYSVEGLLSAISRLYRREPLPPHFYLVYDLIYEQENVDVVIELAQDGEIGSYVLVWKYGRGGVVHVWGDKGPELLQHVSPDITKPHIVELYSVREEFIERVSSFLLSAGFKEVEVKRFHDMICTEEVFKPSANEHITVRLNPSYAEIFAEFVRRRGEEITLEEAREKLTKRAYYGVLVGDKLASAGAVCAKLPEMGLICDVYTGEEFRGRGYATAVTSAATRKVVSSGATAFLCVEEGNELAIRIYKKLGYSILRTRPWIVAKP
ncbi:MAG: GNAT family N-acetyltransferase [Desulfurococcaceae archaeon]|jgi:ribosomal protein S18 acetylase RimI-like enzyme|nr:GNAT family N-acetyltransferase [Desulfurococcaceae archaeon]